MTQPPGSDGLQTEHDLTVPPSPLGILTLHESIPSCCNSHDSVSWLSVLRRRVTRDALSRQT